MASEVITCYAFRATNEIREPLDAARSQALPRVTQPVNVQLGFQECVHERTPSVSVTRLRVDLRSRTRSAFRPDEPARRTRIVGADLRGCFTPLITVKVSCFRGLRRMHLESNIRAKSEGAFRCSRLAREPRVVELNR